MGEAKDNEIESEEEEEMAEESKREIRISWWNGGGKLVPRLKANLELQEYMSTNPDMFCYGEALATKKTKEMNMPGYYTIMHKASMEGNRRGMVVYYRPEHAHTITKDACSRAFDILWLRMKTKKEERIIGFFYAPRAHHTERTRERFYDELRKGIDKYKGERIYLLGDTNARLGLLQNDRNANGRLISKPKK